MPSVRISQQNSARALTYRSLGARAMREMNRRVRIAESELRTMARNAQTFMKRTAPWNDRTGAARDRLTVDLEVKVMNDLNRTFNLVFKHGVYYGRFLEYHFGGAYAILNPTAMRYKPRAAALIRDVLGSRRSSRVGLETGVDTSSTFVPGPNYRPQSGKIRARVNRQVRTRGMRPSGAR